MVATEFKTAHAIPHYQARTLTGPQNHACLISMWPQINMNLRLKELHSSKRKENKAACKRLLLSITSILKCLEGLKHGLLAVEMDGQILKSY